VGVYFKVEVLDHDGQQHDWVFLAQTPSGCKMGLVLKSGKILKGVFD
jgi:hypothetical protein